MNWHERIEDAEGRGGFTKADLHDAQNWFSCACGEQDPRIPRHPDSDEFEGAPIDETLFTLGGDFFTAVHNNDYDEAADLLNQIEKRAGEVLAEQGI